jgi:hypothetical protein
MAEVFAVELPAERDRGAVEISWHPITHNVIVSYNGKGFVVTLDCLEDGDESIPNFAHTLNAMDVPDAYARADYLWGCATGPFLKILISQEKQKFHNRPYANRGPVNPLVYKI